MTPQAFRKLALALPHTTEKAHMDHPDFRVKNHVFASLWPDGESAMVRLTPAQQAACVKTAPGMFEPLGGAWGARGCTRVLLKAARVAQAREAVSLAWRNIAPKAYMEDLQPPARKAARRA